MARHRYVDISWSKMRQSLAELLKELGYIDSFLVKKEESRGKMRIFLKYGAKQTPVIQGIQRVSKPGCRKYAGYKDLKPIYGGLGTMIVSTSKGLLPTEKAREQKLGGELLCKVW
jgi:small subunit ribosomal protein S8